MGALAQIPLSPPLSSRLIALMGGRLSVESQLGRGSTFFFTFPLETNSPGDSSHP